MLINWSLQPVGEGWDDYEPDVVVWVDVQRVDVAFGRNLDHYVGRGGSGAGQASRYATVERRFLSQLPMWMPILRVCEDGTIRFTDGRHRFAWVRDHGARAIAVAADPDNASALDAGFGTSVRECRVALA